MSDRVYYIYAPPWVEWSAGTKVLHYLCDILNEIGEDSYLAIHGPKLKSDETSPGRNTPILNSELVKQHEREEKIVVAIYPEGVAGNPIGGAIVVRWLLNFPSLLGGEVAFSVNENVWAYSQNIANAYFSHTGRKIPVLFVPAVTFSEINAVDDSAWRDGDYEIVYAQKFRALGGKPAIDLNGNVIEITRFNSNSTSRSQTLNLIKFAKKVHVFENTSIATEAALFGVPVICYKNKFFDRLIAEHELGIDGVSWFPSPEIPTNSSNARERLDLAWEAIRQNLIICMQSVIIQEDCSVKSQQIMLPKRTVLSRHIFSRAKVLIQQKGLIVFGHFLLNYIRRIINQV